MLSVPRIGSALGRRLVERFGRAEAFGALCEGGSDLLGVIGDRINAQAVVGAARASEGSGQRAYDRTRRLGHRIWIPGDEGWNAAFNGEPSPPLALFAAGKLSALDYPRVAIVGTRSATPSGNEFAQRLGRDLANAGVGVVSGLAFGIDGSAHAGALTGGALPDRPTAPIGVVGSGLDVIYPRQHRELWRRVAEAGLLLSEYPPGMRPTERSFPARNRLIAALSEVVVVVESNLSGGSLQTAECAWARGRKVMAVPGNPFHPSCAGSNALLRRVFATEQRVVPCIDTSDVLTLLALEQAIDPSRLDFRPDPTPFQRQLLQELGWDPRSASQLVVSLGAAPGSSAGSSLGVTSGKVASALGELELDGWVRRLGGMWQQCPA